MEAVRIVNKAPEFSTLYNFFIFTDNYFIPGLSERVNLADYTKKLIAKGQFLLIYEEEEIIAALIYYVSNLDKCSAFVTSLVVKKRYQGKGYGSALLRKMKNELSILGCLDVSLEVDKNNLIARKMYTNLGFKAEEKDHRTMKMLYMLGGV